MYQSSPSTSSSQKSTVAAGGSGGLIRYGSAPGSLLASAVDSVIGSASREEFSALGSNLLRHHQYFSADSSSSSSKSESICKVSSSYDPKATSLQRSYGFNEISLQSNGGSAGTESSYSLARQRSSPAGFFSHLLADQNGFSITRGNDNYSPQGCSSVGRGASRLKTQLSFTGQDTLAQISEGNECILNGDMGLGSGSQSYNAASSSFAGMDLWEASNSIGFTTTQPNKRAKNVDGDFFAHLDSLENQFSVSQTSLEMGGGDSFLHLPEDTVPCKMRAKRGFATHPRSIAERERRTRISGKLKKLQELVPNMDKQTSYSDMLDLAVQHIKGLQNQVQKLQKDQENCTCGCKQSS